MRSQSLCRNWLRLVTSLGCVLIGLAGCASLPEHVDRPVTHAVSPDPGGPLTVMTKQVAPDQDRTALALLPVSSVAFETRLALAGLATHTLDVQYYLLQADGTGLTFMRALRDAALRGVRVRILIDDLYTGGEDPILTGLASFPNVEIRLFNPFMVGRFGFLSRLILSANDFERIDHRMHNKVFMADNTMAVAGGRNIADEYFMESALSNFIDVDLFLAGPAVHDLEAIFDGYWNSAYVYPLGSIVKLPADPLAGQRFFSARADVARGPEHEDLPPEVAPFGVIPPELEAGKLSSVTLAHTEAVADPVDKAGGSKEASYEGTVSGRVIEEMGRAKQEVLITSPYFIPGARGLAMMKAGVEHGGHVILLTNSLASTDEPAVHAVYAEYRRAMVAMGVEVMELSPTLARTRHRLGAFGKSNGSLHAKIVTIDHHLLYMGSMNLDPRSAHHNTEVGFLIESPKLVATVSALMDGRSVYHLRLDPKGQMQWAVETDEGELVYDEDPETNWWLRTKSWLLSTIISDTEL